METEVRLLNRLDEMKTEISKHHEALALIGLGSVGVELSRLDRYSDIDFFLIVEDDAKFKYIDDLSWLSKAHPLSYTFRNTKDGYKFFFSDGIYGEFAVFGRSEVDAIVQAEGRLIWKNDSYNHPNLTQAKGKFPKLEDDHIDFRVNEALTNLYVGLCRVLRGEKLSGYRFIETYAFNNLIQIIYSQEIKEPIHQDLFNLERRFEFIYPKFANSLEEMLSGYENLHHSAYAILKYLDQHFEVHPFIKKEIMTLIERLASDKS
jgi:lincosamide nucleotidyltransferase B/F